MEINGIVVKGEIKIMIKVLVVDDVAILRNSLKFMLEVDKDINVIGTASNGREAYEICHTLMPDIVIMDLRMPDCDGVQGTELIKSSFPEIKVIVLTTFKEEEDIQEAIGSGADGYILKDIEPDELIAAIKNTYKGFYTVQKSVYESMAKNAQKRQSEPNTETKTDSPSELYDKNGKPILSPQDIEIIRYIVNGKNSKEISKLLFLSEGHVRNQISRIIRKLDLTDRMQLSLFAVKNNLL